MDDIRRWNNIRWGAVVLYIGLVLSLIGLLFLLPSWETELGMAILLVSVIGIVPLIVIINIPFIRMLLSEGPTRQGRNERKGPHVRGTTVYSDSVRMNPLIWVIVPINLYLLLLALTSEEIMMLIFSVIIVTLLSLSLVFFWKLDIQADRYGISFHFGPFGRTLSVDEIGSIEAVDVHPIRDFMGWGWRSGSDGSIGYISNSKEGVRIVTKGGRTYTVTCHRPEELARIVRRSIRR